MLTQFIKSTTFFQGFLSSQQGYLVLGFLSHFRRKVAIRRSLGQRKVLD